MKSRVNLHCKNEHPDLRLIMARCYASILLLHHLTLLKYTNTSTSNLLFYAFQL